MTSSTPPPRPPTPQVLLHHLPSKPTEDDTRNKPSKYIVLITAPTATAGKLQIARSVAAALSCPLYQGDSLHDSSAKASSVGAGAGAGPNEARYRRMWLSKMTRTGLLFPEESRPATEGSFPGFGGGSLSSSTTASRRGSVSSIASSARLSDTTGPSQSSSSDTSSSHDSEFISSSSYPALPVTSTFSPDGSSAPAPGGVNTVFTLSADERRRRSNPALMVLTHPELDPWHKSAIRTAVGDYGIGVIFAPLYEEQEAAGEDDRDLPILRPLDPRTMSTFPVSAVGQDPKLAAVESESMGRELSVKVDVNDDVEGKTLKIIEAVRDVMA
ncbi:hypothetical protein CONLIGDRAFT_688153 [Coniochaeta ligniaria NRRL 30616]|uniref:Uncharacterized protein n=1 Tax=Coniochaeta ligniaria NRRL 30616 TaxID=1408157 RepID=A0A1J7K2I0_9PEZI|nr:hypothetical protein CONLIGDRAFT_688153 [Coniochaeta ligniaria NRRL 30616]